MVPNSETDVIGYAIRPTRGGANIRLTEPTEELLAHVYERLWIAGIGDGGGVATAYGFISNHLR